jgi:hypothetical protein
MPLPKIVVKLYKDGRQVARFRDSGGLVRTRVGPVNWVRAEQVKQLAEYGIALQVGQACGDRFRWPADATLEGRDSLCFCRPCRR